MKRISAPPTTGQIAAAIGSFAFHLRPDKLEAEDVQAFIDAGKISILKAFLARMFRERSWLRVTPVCSMYVNEVPNPADLRELYYENGNTHTSAQALIKSQVFDNPHHNVAGEIKFFTAQELGMDGWSYKDVYGSDGRVHLEALKFKYCHTLDVLKIMWALENGFKLLPGGQYTIFPLYSCPRDTKVCIQCTRTQVNHGQSLITQDTSTLPIHPFSLIAVRG